MKTCIIAGGEINTNFLRRQLDAVSSCICEKPYNLVACDRGLEACLELKLCPDFAIGDFDSVSPQLLAEAKDLGIEIIKLNPIKDDTDAEAAINYAINRFSIEDDYYLFGATGARLDHLLGNFALLGYAHKKGCKLFIVDECNRIQILSGGESLSISKGGQYGKYISLIPYFAQAKGVTLKGFKYPLTDADLDGFSTITISNEIAAASGTISLNEGYLLIVEAKDKSLEIK